MESLVWIVEAGPVVESERASESVRKSLYDERDVNERAILHKDTYRLSERLGKRCYCVALLRLARG